MRRTHHKKLKRLLHTSTLKIISQLASTYLYMSVCLCWWWGENENHHKYLSACVCVRVYLWNFPQRRKRTHKKKPQTQIYMYVCALQRRRLRNFPSLCFMLRFFRSLIFRSSRSLFGFYRVHRSPTPTHLQSGSRSSSNCNTNPLALSLLVRALVCWKRAKLKN